MLLSFKFKKFIVLNLNKLYSMLIKYNPETDSRHWFTKIENG